MRISAAFLFVVLAGCHTAANPDLGFSPDLDGTADLGGEDLAGQDATAMPVGLNLAVPCTDTTATVYMTPMGLPPLGPTTLGDVVRCVHDVALDEDGPAVDTTLAGKSIVLGTSSSGVTVYRVAFRTTRGNGSAGASTARVYVPTTPHAFPLPVIVAGHATEGMADSCAPSGNPASLLDVALPWAAKGYAVIAPDYSGLGNEGLQAYLDNRDQGQSLLDGARALRKMFPTAFSDKVVISGWSQGGGSALSAQALAGTYGCGGTLVATIAFAPEWPIRYNSFALVDLVQNPDAFVAYDPADSNISYSNHAIWTQRAYGYFANFSPSTSDGGAAFPSATAASFLSTMNTLCGAVAIGAAIYIDAHPPFGAKNGDLFDPTFRTAFVACLADPTQGACTGLGKEYYTYLGNNQLTADPNGGKVLMVQGLADTVLPPAKEAACIAAKLQTEGLAPQICVDTLAQHTDVTNRNIGYAISWAESVLTGATAVPCPATTSLPASDCS